MLEAWKDEPLSESLLFKIHRSLTSDTLEEEKQGRYRVAEDGPVTVSKGFETVFVPPRVDTLAARMRRLIEFANQSRDQENVFLHPVLKAILLHTLLAYEHPFCDGNGRTARALFSWFLLREGYWQTSYVSLSRELAKNRKAYDSAYLAMENCHFDTTYNVLVNLRAFKDALESLHTHLSEQIEDSKRIRACFGDLFNSRQLDLLDHSLRHEGYLYTVAEHARWHQITLNTARSDLLDLKKKGYLKLSYKGRLQEFRSTGLFAQQAGPKEM
jgi:Fic family protein